jgi:hypothetical protein
VRAPTGTNEHAKLQVVPSLYEIGAKASQARRRYELATQAAALVRQRIRSASPQNMCLSSSKFRACKTTLGINFFWTRNLKRSKSSSQTNGISTQGSVSRSTLRTTTSLPALIGSTSLCASIPATKLGSLLSKMLKTISRLTHKSRTQW